MKRSLAPGKIITYSVLLILLVFALFPVYWMLVTSFKTQAEVYNLVPTFWPKKFVITSYITLLFEKKFFVNIKNSLIVSLTVATTSVFLSMLAAYAIAKLKFKGRKTLSRSILYAYLMPRTVLFIPLYILVTRLGIEDSLFALIVIYPTFTIPYATWMLITYFKTIPVEIEEAAIIDGCSQIGSMFRIAFPLSSPGIVSTLIFSFTLCWSEYLYALVVLTKGEYKTITLGLSEMVVADTFAWGPLMGGSILATIPVIALYIFASKFLVSGMTMGGVKG